MQIKAKGKNVVSIRYDKTKEENYNGLIAPMSDNNATILSKVISIGKDVVETVLDEIVFVPVTAVKVNHEGKDYFICDENNLLASLNPNN